MKLCNCPYRYTIDRFNTCLIVVLLMAFFPLENIGQESEEGLLHGSQDTINLIQDVVMEVEPDTAVNMPVASGISDEQEKINRLLELLESSRQTYNALYSLRSSMQAGNIAKEKVMLHANTLSALHEEYTALYGQVAISDNSLRRDIESFQDYYTAARNIILDIELQTAAPVSSQQNVAGNMRPAIENAATVRQQNGIDLFLVLGVITVIIIIAGGYAYLLLRKSSGPDQKKAETAIAAKMKSRSHYEVKKEMFVAGNREKKIKI